MYVSHSKIMTYVECNVQENGNLKILGGGGGYFRYCFIHWDIVVQYQQYWFNALLQQTARYWYAIWNIKKNYSCGKDIVWKGCTKLQ